MPAAADSGLATALTPGHGLSQADFREVQNLARSVFGLDLKDGKQALVESRLNKRVRDLGLRSIKEYLSCLKEDITGLELVALIDALTTNYTCFLREAPHFRFLAETILPKLCAKPQFSIWSAGCSTGEEPYSILFQTEEALGPDAASRLRIVATDISTRALQIASSGIYPESRLSELPESWKRRYFLRGHGASAGHVRVRPEYRQRIEFRRQNLMEPFRHSDVFSVIFCRNVMIYFDKPTQERLAGKFTERLEPDGYLLIGHSEGLMGIRHNLRYVMPAVYRKQPAGA